MNKYKFSKEINEELMVLQSSDNYHWFFGLIYDYAVILLAIVASIKVSFYFYPISLVIIASRMRAIATLLHDAAHLRLCKNRGLNNFIGKYLTGLLIFEGFYSYIESHVINHHVFLGNKDKDPDYQYYISKGLYKPMKKLNFVINNIICPIILFNAISFLKYLFKHRLFCNKKEAMIISVIWAVILSFFIYFSLFSYLFLFWFIPLLLIFPVIGWFIEISEHYPLLGSTDMELYMSRNRNNNYIEKFFFGVHNESYHLVHHLKPGIPYWNIVKAHKIMLQDMNYYNANIRNAGIFSSRNDNPSILRQIIKSNQKYFCTDK